MSFPKQTDPQEYFMISNPQFYQNAEKYVNDIENFLYEQRWEELSGYKEFFAATQTGKQCEQSEFQSFQNIKKEIIPPQGIQRNSQNEGLQVQNQDINGARGHFSSDIQNQSEILQQNSNLNKQQGKSVQNQGTMGQNQKDDEQNYFGKEGNTYRDFMKDIMKPIDQQEIVQNLLADKKYNKHKNIQSILRAKQYEIKIEEQEQEQQLQQQLQIQQAEQNQVIEKINLNCQVQNPIVLQNFEQTQQVSQKVTKEVEDNNQQQYQNLNTNVLQRKFSNFTDKSYQQINQIKEQIQEVQNSSSENQKQEDKRKIKIEHGEHQNDIVQIKQKQKNQLDNLQQSSSVLQKSDQFFEENNISQKIKKQNKLEINTDKNNSGKQYQQKNQGEQYLSPQKIKVEFQEQEQDQKQKEEQQQLNLLKKDEQIQNIEIQHNLIQQTQNSIRNGVKVEDSGQNINSFQNYNKNFNSNYNNNNNFTVNQGSNIKVKKEEIIQSQQNNQENQNGSISEVRSGQKIENPVKVIQKKRIKKSEYQQQKQLQMGIKMEKQEYVEQNNNGIIQQQDVGSIGLGNLWKFQQFTDFLKPPINPGQQLQDAFRKSSKKKKNKESSFPINNPNQSQDFQQLQFQNGQNSYQDHNQNQNRLQYYQQQQQQQQFQQQQQIYQQNNNYPINQFFNQNIEFQQQQQQNQDQNHNINGFHSSMGNSNNNDLLQNGKRKRTKKLFYNEQDDSKLGLKSIKKKRKQVERQFPKKNLEQLQQQQKKKQLLFNESKKKTEMDLEKEGNSDSILVYQENIQNNIQYQHQQQQHRTNKTDHRRNQAGQKKIREKGPRRLVYDQDLIIFPRVKERLLGQVIFFLSSFSYYERVNVRKEAENKNVEIQYPFTLEQVQKIFSEYHENDIKKFVYQQIDYLRGDIKDNMVSRKKDYKVYRDHICKVLGVSNKTLLDYITWIKKAYCCRYFNLLQEEQIDKQTIGNLRSFIKTALTKNEVSMEDFERTSRRTKLSEVLQKMGRIY